MRNPSIFKLVLFWVPLLFINCASHELNIISDTSWSCAVNNITVDGTGNRTIDIDIDEHPCYVCQKQTEEGFLELSCGDCEEGRTTAAFGIVSGCFSGAGF